jgi:hypothetical protein
MIFFEIIEDHFTNACRCYVIFSFFKNGRWGEDDWDYDGVLLETQNEYNEIDPERLEME